MYRDRALAKFRRYYFHGVRNRKSSEDAALEAFWKTRHEILALIGKDPIFKDDIEREEAWGDALSATMMFWHLLKDIPIDFSRVGPSNPPISGEPGTETSIPLLETEHHE